MPRVRDVAAPPNTSPTAYGSIFVFSTRAGTSVLHRAGLRCRATPRDAARTVGMRATSPRVGSISGTYVIEWDRELDLGRDLPSKY